MIYPITLGDRTGTVVYLDVSWHPTTPEHATLARVLFDDGGSAFYTITPITDPYAQALKFDKNQVRDPKGSPTGGQFAKDSGGRPHQLGASTTGIRRWNGEKMHVPHASDVSGGVSHRAMPSKNYSSDSSAKIPHGTGFANVMRNVGTSPIVGKEKFQNNPQLVRVDAKGKALAKAKAGEDPALTPLLSDAKVSGDSVETGCNESFVVEMHDGTKALYKPERGELWGGGFTNSDIDDFITNRDLSLAEREAMAYEIGHAIFGDQNPVPPTVLREALEVQGSGGSRPSPSDSNASASSDQGGGGGYDSDELQQMYDSYEEGAREKAMENVDMGDLRSKDRQSHANNLEARAEEVQEIWDELAEENPDLLVNKPVDPDASVDPYGHASALRGHPALPMGSQQQFDRRPDQGEIDVIDLLDELDMGGNDDVSRHITMVNRAAVKEALLNKMKEGYSGIASVDTDKAKSHWNDDDFYENHNDTENQRIDDQVMNFNQWKSHHGYNQNSPSYHSAGDSGRGGRVRNPRAPHPNGGSLQQINQDAGRYGDPSPEDGARMAVLDYVLGTMDRHGNNIMYEDDVPVAIDNGYSIPGSGKDTPDRFTFRSMPVQTWLDSSETDVSDEMRDTLTKALAATDWNAFCDRHPGMSAEERGGLLGRVIKMRTALEESDGLFRLWKKQRNMM